MKGLAAVLLALSLPISSVVGKQLAGPSARVVLITQTASATKAAATPSNPEPNFRWVGLGEEERRLEVNADFANKKENVAAILDAVIKTQPQTNNGTLAIDVKEETLRQNVLETLVTPMLMRRKRKYGKFLAYMYDTYNDVLQECSYETCENMKCRYRPGTDRQDALLQESCIGARNMARYQVLRSDYETVMNEVKDRFARAFHEDIGFFVQQINEADVVDNIAARDEMVEFDKVYFAVEPELAGDWSCTGIRQGAVGCPTLTVSGVTTTVTVSVIKTRFHPIVGLTSHTYLWPQTWTSTELMHPEFPLVTGTSENGPDEDQMMQDPLPEHIWV